MGFHQTATAQERQGLATTRSASSAASSATCPRPSGSSSSQDTGFDGWEEASWELDLRQCDTDAGAAAYAKERVDLAKKHGLEIFTVATHLQGQVLGDEPTRQDAASSQRRRGRGGVQGVARQAATTRRGPTRTSSPTTSASWSTPRPRRTCWRASGYAGHLGKLQDRKVALPGFVGSPAHCWSHWFLFPPLPGEHRRATSIPDVRDVSAWSCWSSGSARCGTCARSTASRSTWSATRASGRWATSSRPRDYINHMCKAGYEGVVGFNLDGSHMEWQNVSVIEFIREFAELHPLRPRQGRVGGPRALPGRAARRPPADGPLGQRLELRDRRHRPRREQRWRRSSSS